MPSPAAEDGAVIAFPARLAGLALVLLVQGARAVDRDGGGLPAGIRRDLAEIQEVLAPAAAAPARAASGPPPGRMGAASRDGWSTVEASAAWGIPARRIRKLCEAGRIVAAKSGRDWIIDPASTVPAQRAS